MATVRAALSESDLDDAFDLRFATFVMEQGVSMDGERDEVDDDPSTLHIVAYSDSGTCVGVGRLVAPGSDVVHGLGTGHGHMDPAVPHIGRVAVSRASRGTGVGREVMAFLEREAVVRYGKGGTVRVELSSQEHAIPFYQHIGYTPYGEPYLDEGIWHRDAYKDVRALPFD